MAMVRKNVLSYLRDDIILGDGYPWDLMFMHCLKAIASWRDFDESNGGKANSKTYAFVCAYFCHCFGGTCFRDWFMGGTPGLFMNKDQPQTYLLAFALVYYSPFDVAYTMINTPRTITSLGVSTFEAIDSATTICGTVEKMKTLYPENTGAPIIGALCAGVGGSVFRYLERTLGRGWEVETEWSRPTIVLRRTLVYTFAYMYLRNQYGVSKARLYVTYFHVFWSLAQELTGASLDFTEGFL